MAESVSGKLLAAGFTFGDYDAAFMIEAPDDESAAAVSLAVTAGGAVKAAWTTKLLSGSQWVAALEKGSIVANAYQPSR